MLNPPNKNPAQYKKWLSDNYEPVLKHYYRCIKTGIIYSYLEVENRYTLNTKPEILTKSMIHYLTPYSVDKNIGKAYNEAIRSINAKPDDWIVMMDGDTMFLTPDWGRQIAEVAKSTDFDLIGCMTGRIRSKHQLHGGKFDPECDMYKNYEIARQLETDHWGEVENISEISGFFMMFRYKTWKRVCGFREDDITTDMHFSIKVSRSGGKIGVMKGLYVFHGYRLWEKDYKAAMDSYGHLVVK